MDFETVDIHLVLDVFLLLLIGIGPKIALVPYVELTAEMDASTKARVTRKMLVTATGIALVLVALGEFLTRLLHFSTAALSIAGGVILLIISVSMVLRSDPSEDQRPVAKQDPMRLAVYPLAVPYLLNPAGIVVLVTISADAASFATFAVAIGVLALVIGLDVLVFRWANRVSDHLDESRMLVTEKVFGFLLAALAIQLALDGLHEVGAIQLTLH